jgi:hypothetical protein
MMQGSVVGPNGEIFPTSMWECCEKMDQKLVRNCSYGCCNHMRCKNCGKRWTEVPAISVHRQA